MKEIPYAGHALPSDRRARQGVWLLLASLGIFFVASLILYMVYIFLRLKGSPEGPTPFHLPKSFIGSTVLLVGVSLALHWACQVARRDQFGMVKFLIASALVLSLLFFAVQGEGMWYMLTKIQPGVEARSNAYALTLCLAIIHALHVVGGLVGLVWVQVNAMRHRYDHERNFGLIFCALYWHFLDVVWVIMLGGFMLASVLLNAKS